jgi:hypothetical protein
MRRRPLATVAGAATGRAKPSYGGLEATELWRAQVLLRGPAGSLHNPRGTISLVAFLRMSDQNLTPETIRHFLDRDFRDAWDALANIPEARGRGNFMFGREAIALLELASRVCHEDPARQAINDLSAAIEQIEPRYFTPLPAPAHWPRDFDLPSSPARGPREQQLLCVIYDLVRNGQAHQRQQIMVETTDAKTFGISLTGAVYGRTLGDRLTHGRPPEHLALLQSDVGDLFVVLCPEVLFLDLLSAITASGVFQRGFAFTHLGRGKPGKPHYAYTAAAVEQALHAGGLVAYTPPAEVMAPLTSASARRSWRSRAAARIVSLRRSVVDRAQRLVHR